MTTKKSIKKDEQAVSPVIAVIMLIAITVVIAAVVAAFAYGIIGGVKKAPSCALVVEGATAGQNTIRIIHHGGNKVLDAFDNQTSNENAPWGTMEVRREGETVASDCTIALNSVGINTTAKVPFEAGDELSLAFTEELRSGESITVVYIPTQDVLQRITVV
jgi:flagellin-like protein